MILIMGYGHVGQGMTHIFPDAKVVDPAKSIQHGFSRNVANPILAEPPPGRAELAIVCVPTPPMPDGSCDTSIVAEVVCAVDAELFLIKSTVTPGTTQRLRFQTEKRIVFSPEYMGESRYWTPSQYPQPYTPMSHGFFIMGGDDRDCADIEDILLPRIGPATRFRFMTSLEAELVKYFENSYLAMKVTFANEIRTICEAAGARYHIVREGWIDDSRIGPMHTAAFKDAPGFSGKCLPKDINALAAYCRSIGIPNALLESVIKANVEQTR